MVDASNFTANEAPGGAGGALALEAVPAAAASLQLRRARFERNSAAGCGGAVAVVDADGVLLDDCVMIGACLVWGALCPWLCACTSVMLFCIQG